MTDSEATDVLSQLGAIRGNSLAQAQAAQHIGLLGYQQQYANAVMAQLWHAQPAESATERRRSDELLLLLDEEP